MRDTNWWSARAVVFVGLISLAGVGARGEATTMPATVPTATTVPGTTRPADGAVRRPGVSFVIDRLKRVVGQIELSDEQKTKVAAIFDQASKDGQDLVRGMQDDSPQDRFGKVQTFGSQLRGQVEQVLTDEQKKSLEQKLATGPGLGGGGFGSGGGGRPGGNLEAMQQALAKLELTDEQKQQVRDLMESTRKQIADLRQKAANGENIQADVQQIRQDVRAKLQTILTPDQMQAMAQAIQQARQNQNVGAGVGEATTRPTPADLQTSGPEVGSAAPDVKLVELGGNALALSKYKGHVLVLEFGSFSCPVFRDHVQAMESLKAQEGPRAFIMIVYTREAFPAGDKDVQRNKDEGVSVAAATNLDQRKAEAEETQRTLRITIPIMIDSMDDAVSNAFGGFPNGAIVIGKDGNISAKEQWANPDSLRRAIDEANEPAVAKGH